MGNRTKSKANANGAAPAQDEKFSLISNQKLISLYRNLVKCAKSAHQGRNSNGRGGRSRGHDAAVVGTAIDLGPGDLVCSLDRPMLSALSRQDAIEMLLLHRHENGGSASAAKNSAANGFSGFSHSVLGAALTNKTARNGKVAVVYCTGPASDCLHDAIHIATVHGLPIVFVQQPVDGEPQRQPKRARRFPDETPWFPSITVDTNDVVAVYRVANEAISRARLGRGPTVIECRPYRLNGNSGHGDDPVRNMEHYLRARDLFDSSLERETAADLRNG